MTQTAAPEAPAIPDPRRWWALAVIGTAQLMLAVDGTIMNIALPSAQRDLGLSSTATQWVVTSYALAFAGLLLLGGRVSDLLGRRRGLTIGLLGFAAASVLGGLAPNGPTLLTARALLGVCAALTTPSVLALLSTTFPTPAERARAFGIFGTIMGSGTGIGVLLGGILTDVFSWRSALFVNVPIALAVVVGARYVVRPMPRTPGLRIDLVGAGLATSGLLSLVYGLSRIGAEGGPTSSKLGFVLAGLLLLTVFLLAQRRAAAPLLPLRVLTDRRRAAAFLAMLTWGLSLLVTFLFISFFLQTVLGYPPVRAGLAFLPYAAAILVGVRLVSRVMARVELPVLVVPGLLSVAGAFGLLARLDADGGYLTHVLPVFLLLGLGTALTLPVANSTATLGAGPDTAVAGATAMTAQQIGFSLGPAVLGTLAAHATAEAAPTMSAAAATVHGYAVAAPLGSALVLAGALSVALLWRTARA